MTKTSKCLASSSHSGNTAYVGTSQGSLRDEQRKTNLTMPNSNVESKLILQRSLALLFSGRFIGGEHPQNMSRLKWHEIK